MGRFDGIWISIADFFNPVKAKRMELSVRAIAFSLHVHMHAPHALLTFRGCDSIAQLGLRIFSFEIKH
jgi:hypothetical protein